MSEFKSEVIFEFAGDCDAIFCVLFLPLLPLLVLLLKAFPDWDVEEDDAAE